MIVCIILLTNGHRMQFFGYKNDIYWVKFVQNMLLMELQQDYPELNLGEVILQAGSLHIYERHFKFLDELL